MKSIFISSTFKDMQAERDMLHEKIFPRLRRVIAEYGEDVQELDLRWGVDTAKLTEEESGRLVLKVCIDAIDRCLPFIIVLLGERYGWIPREDIVASTNDTRVDTYYEPGMSVTNLEIQYGALREAEVLDHCVFCMRNPNIIDEIEPEYRGIFEGESAEHKRKLSNLKEKIRANENALILDYDAKWEADKHKICGLEEFGEKLYGILEKMIREEYKERKELDWKEKILLETRRTKEQYLSSYVERPIEEAIICESMEKVIEFRKITKEHYTITQVKGVAGTGKSALMAACAQRFEKLGYPVILYFSGNPGCQDPKVLKQMMAYELEKILQTEHEESEMPLDDYLHMLDEKVKEKRVVCIIDALDQLFEKEHEARLDIPSLCPHISFLLSSLEDFEYVGADGKALSYREVYRKLYVKELTEENCKQMIAYTAKKRGKKLDNEIISAILEKENSRNPLYLSNVLQRFFMMDGKEFEAAEKLGAGMEGIHLYMEQLLNGMPEKQEEMVLYLLNETMKHFEAEYLYEVMCLIALSKFGLKESELLEILKIEGKTFAQIEFQQMVSYLYEAFVQKEDGKWTFRHRLFMEAVRNHMSTEEKNHYIKLLTQYAEKNETFLRTEGYYYIFETKADFGFRLLEEWETYDVSFLGEYIAELIEHDSSYEQYFLEMAENHGTDRFASYWEEEFHQYSYQKTVREFHVRMLRILIEKAALGPKRLCDCMNKVMSFGTKAERAELIERYTEKAKLQFGQLDEAEKEYQSSAAALWRAFVASDSDDSTQSLEWNQKALKHIESAEQLRPEDEKIQYRKICLKRDVFWDYVTVKKECPIEMLQSALKDILQSHEELDNSNFTRERIGVLGDLMECYCANDLACFNMEQGQYYGDQALELGRRWIQKYPTADNMSAYIRILYQVADISQKRYKYMFYKEAYEYAKRMYGICRTERAKETYAGICYNRGKTAVYAWEEYQKKNGYKIEEKAGELEQEIPKRLEEAVGLYEDLLRNHPDNQRYVQRIQDCKIEKAKFGLGMIERFQLPSESEFVQKQCVQVIEEMKPAAEEILKSGSNYHIFETYGVLADAERYLGDYSALEQSAEVMEKAAVKLLEKRNTIWNQRRMLKSRIYQAMILYQTGKDAEAFLKKAYECYREMSADARAGQEKLADWLYEMYLQTMVEKKNPRYAKILEEEAKQLGRRISYNYYDKAIRLDEKAYTSAYLLGNDLEIWNKIEDVEKPDKRQAEHMVKRLSSILTEEAFLREQSRQADEVCEILTRMAEYKRIAGWKKLSEEERLVFQKYISTTFYEFASVSYWKYVVRYAKEADVKLWRPILIFVIEYCCAAEAYEDALLYFEQIEEKECWDGIAEELQFIKLVCQGVIAERNDELEKVKELTEPVRRMKYYQKLCKTDQSRLKKYEEFLRYAAWGLLAYTAEEEEKGRYFKKLLVAGAGYGRETAGDIIRHMHLFEREDTKELIECVSAEDMLQISRAVQEILIDTRNTKAKIKSCLQIADKLAQVEQKKYQEEAWMYYRMAFNTDWTEPKEMDPEEAADMDLEEVLLRLRAHDGLLDVTGKYQRKQLKRYLLLVIRCYQCTKDAVILQKAVEDKKKIRLMKVNEDDSTMAEAEEDMMKFFMEWIRLQREDGVRAFLKYMEMGGMQKWRRLYKLVELREEIREYVSKEEIEKLNRVLEEKGRYDIHMKEMKLKEIPERRI